MLYTAAQVRALDLAAIASGIPGDHLMTRAGEAVVRHLRERWPTARRIQIWCGTGNNGGDGFVIARLLLTQGLDVEVIQVGERARIGGDALMMFNAAVRASVSMRAWQTAYAPPTADVIVDAVLGIGMRGEITTPWREAIIAINHAACPVLAVDIPSGLDADSGMVNGVAVRAHATVSFIGLKRGLFTGLGRDHAGDILFDDLSVPAEVYQKVTCDVSRLCDVPGKVQNRLRSAHKGDFGHVLICGGQPGMGGAALLAARAALRVGAGLVSVATHPANAAHAWTVQPELMCHGIDDVAALNALLSRATVVGVGPGLGQGAWGRAIWGRVIDTSKPLVVDADGLNWLAHNAVQRDDWVLTPHPGEAARLLNTTVSEVQRDRYAAVVALQEAYGGICVLKGAGSLVCAPGARIRVCNAGNPGMATAGMGDVLTGVIAGCIAQFSHSTEDLFDVVARAVYLHAHAGDRAAQQDGEIGLAAGDLLPWIRKGANGG